MTQKKRPSGGENSAPREAPGKKPYRKPEFRYERVFETLALACGKISGNQQQCRFNRKTS
ncbi:MAG TPA: hypothetical protein VMT28_16765 [Terriglobales bacterium]|jgi:hypothetical protein|nr:hypothetical protein [Terriglobales bacterium]